MLNVPIKVFLLLFATALAVTVGNGQPPGVGPPTPMKHPQYLDSFRPYYTALPDLKMRDSKEESEKPFDFPQLPVVAADAPALRKVQLEQLHECLAYIKRIDERIRIGAYSPDEFLVLIQVYAKMTRVVNDLEEEAAKRVPWYEAAVRWMKGKEKFIESRVGVGTDPPQRLHQVRIERLQAEADLLKLKAKVQKPAGK